MNFLNNFMHSFVTIPHTVAEPKEGEGAGRDGMVKGLIKQFDSNVNIKEK